MFVFYFSDYGGVFLGSKGYFFEMGFYVFLVMCIFENFCYFVEYECGDEVNGFVSFVDFGLMFLLLVGINFLNEMDGCVFLGL